MHPSYDLHQFVPFSCQRGLSTREGVRDRTAAEVGMEGEAEVGFSVHRTSLPQSTVLEDILLRDSRVEKNEFPLRVEHLLHRSKATAFRS